MIEHRSQVKMRILKFFPTKMFDSCVPMVLIMGILLSFTFLSKKCVKKNIERNVKRKFNITECLHKSDKYIQFQIISRTKVVLCKQ